MVLESFFIHRNEEAVCFLLYKVKGNISNLKNYAEFYRISNNFVLINWFRREYFELYKDVLEPFPLTFTVIAFLTLKAVKRGYILDNIVSTSPYTDYIIDKYLQEGEIEELFDYLQKNLDEQLAINQVVLRKDGKYAILEINGEICFAYGRISRDFIDLLMILRESLNQLVKDYFIL